MQEPEHAANHPSSLSSSSRLIWGNAVGLAVSAGRRVTTSRESDLRAACHFDVVWDLRAHLQRCIGLFYADRGFASVVLFVEFLFWHCSGYFGHHRCRAPVSRLPPFSR